TAYSYGWLQFLGQINGLVVFNNCDYSMSTSRHQNKVLDVLDKVGIKVDLTLYETRESLANIRWAIQDEISCIDSAIGAMEQKLLQPRIWKKTKDRLRETIASKQERIKHLENFLTRI